MDNVYSKVMSIGLRGIDGFPVMVESDISAGLPDFVMVGYLASEVKEARQRVRTAIRNSDIQLSPKKITVNLSPADVRKDGTSFDLAIAVALIVGFGFVPQSAVRDMVFLGELLLDGHIRGVNGVLSRILKAKELGIRTCVVPESNAREAAVVDGMTIYGVTSLKEVLDFLYHPNAKEKATADYNLTEHENRNSNYVDFSQVHGQHMMKRAAEVAAAGMHNILMIGTPGSGKTMIASRIPGIMPEMNREEAMSVTMVHSAAGILPLNTPLVCQRPFRAPHHTISTAALIGGGYVPVPGEISLAEKGVLFLDELTEFRKPVLEALRQPMEDRQVRISRVQGNCTFPADVMVIAAMNPCRCGYYPDRTRCNCSEADVKNYLHRISRPLLDRFDLCVEALPVKYSDLVSEADEESSKIIRERVEKAHRIQQERFQQDHIEFNSQMNGMQVKKYCELGSEEKKQMEDIFTRRGYSARGYHRMLKVARTIADLAGEEQIREIDILEASNYRSVHERFWG